MTHLSPCRYLGNLPRLYRLVEHDPQNAEYRATAAAAEASVGALRLRSGDAAGAFAAYRRALAFTTFPLGRLLDARQEAGVVSALAVIPNRDPGMDTPLWADARGRLVAVGGLRPSPDASGPWLFTGLQTARRVIVERVPPGYSELARDVLVPSAKKGDGAFALVPYRIPEDGLWFDLGTPERLAEAEKALTSS